MNQKDIRWKQRFENFEKSFLLLKQSLEIETPSVVRNLFFPVLDRLYRSMKEKTA